MSTEGQKERPVLRLEYKNQRNGAPLTTLYARAGDVCVELPLVEVRVFYNCNGAEIHAFTLHVADNDPAYRLEYAEAK